MELYEDYYCILESRHSEVTGSSIILTAKNKKTTENSIMIDRGMFQELEYLNRNFDLENNINKLIGVIVTHAHLDHVGGLPYLIQQGYNGKFYATNETKLQLETSFTFKGFKSFYKKGLMPYYSEEDINQTKEMIEGCNYNKVIKINDNFSFMLLGNSHILGAAMVLVLVSCDGHMKQPFLFTGDYKESNTLFKPAPIPNWVKKLDNLIVISESTYGIEERKYGDNDDIVKNVACALNNGKTALINSIAGRFPQILYDFKLGQDLGNLSTKYKIYVDSPCGIKQLINHEAILGNFFIPQNFHLLDKKSRKEILLDNSPKIIIATSAGTSNFYMNNSINDPNWIIYFTNHLTPGSKSYNLVNSTEYTNIFYTGKYSGHGRFQEFANLISNFNVKILFANHGESQNRLEFLDEMYKLFDLDYAENLDSSKKYKINSSGIVKTIFYEEIMKSKMAI